MLKHIRGRANLLVVYYSLCSRTELVSLEFEDLVINDDDDENHKLKLRTSKTDRQGIRKNLYLCNEAQKALKDWIDESKISSGKIFRAITATGKIKESLNSSHVGRIYKKIAQFSMIDKSIIRNISGHSMRVGAAQDLMSSGASLSIIMNRGRWTKIDTLMRYIENTNN